MENDVFFKKQRKDENNDCWIQRSGARFHIIKKLKNILFPINAMQWVGYNFHHGLFKIVMSIVKILSFTKKQEQVNLRTFNH